MTLIFQLKYLKLKQKLFFGENFSFKNRFKKKCPKLGSQIIKIKLLIIKYFKTKPKTKHTQLITHPSATSYLF